MEIKIQSIHFDATEKLEACEPLRCRAWEHAVCREDQ